MTFFCSNKLLKSAKTWEKSQIHEKKSSNNSQNNSTRFIVKIKSLNIFGTKTVQKYSLCWFHWIRLNKFLQCCFITLYFPVEFNLSNLLFIGAGGKVVRREVCAIISKGMKVVTSCNRLVTLTSCILSKRISLNLELVPLD